MKIINFKTIIILGVLFMMTSCDDFLDIKPKGVKQAETAEDYAKLMNAENMFWVYDTDNKYKSILGRMGDNATPISTNLSTAGERVYTFAKTVYDESQEDRLWNSEYQKLYIYNTVIKEVLESKGSVSQKNELYAQALFSRAYIYFRLVNFYAKHYTDKNRTELGVPLILEPNVDMVNIKRATIEQVYSQIKSDLDEAFKYLPNSNTDYKFNADKNSYYAMMARIFLCQGNYEKALENANKVLNSYSVLKDYSTLIGADNVKFDAELFPNKDNQTIMARIYFTGLGYKNYMSEDLISAFNTDGSVENDYRCQLFTKEDNSDATKRIYNYPTNYNGGLTTPEIYLIVAECEARIGNVSRAMELVNTLRKNRIKNAVKLETSDKNKALTYVLNERRKEFAGRPEFRLIDLKRLNLNKTITHEFNGKPYSANTDKDANLFVMPIPPNVIQFNPEMKQNER
ncbi:MAG: RagB/SusD family nutrient uptake outer membrane protein [Flavobacteriaceae bacterium]|nr:RagB/SusD family nutrient uptake outer membrane protein [Flavobacteriaceae bacterium]